MSALAKELRRIRDKVLPKAKLRVQTQMDLYEVLTHWAYYADFVERTSPPNIRR